MPCRIRSAMMAFVALSLTAAAPPAAGIRRQLAPTPSFKCAQRMTAVEKMICGNARLSALDNTVALANRTYLHRFHQQSIRPQRVWLARRDRCKDVDCVEAQYWRRLDDFYALDLFTLDPPAAYYRDARIGAILEVTPGGAGSYVFRAQDRWIGLGMEYHNYDNASGIFQLVGRKAVIPAESGDSCSYAFTRLSGDRWRLVEKPSDPAWGGSCGGLNTLLTGTYRRVDKRHIQFAVPAFREDEDMEESAAP